MRFFATVVLALVTISGVLALPMPAPSETGSELPVETGGDEGPGGAWGPGIGPGRGW